MLVSGQILTMTVACIVFGLPLRGRSFKEQVRVGKKIEARIEQLRKDELERQGKAEIEGITPCLCVRVSFLVFDERSGRASGSCAILWC